MWSEPSKWPVYSPIRKNASVFKQHQKLFIKDKIIFFLSRVVYIKIIVKTHNCQTEVYISLVDPFLRVPTEQPTKGHNLFLAMFS